MTQDLVRFLTETAQDTAARANAAPASARVELNREVEELMALRARLVARFQESERADQLQLPFAA